MKTIQRPAAVLEQQTFTALVEISGINPYVDVSPRIAERLGAGVKVPVRVRLEAQGAKKRKATRSLVRDAARLEAIARFGPGGWFRTTIVPSRSSGPRLYLDTWMREAAGVGVGDRVKVTLKADRAPRELAMPEPLRTALDANPAANAAWNALSPSRRREILTYLNFLKTRAALERNTRKVIGLLEARER